MRLKDEDEWQDYRDWLAEQRDENSEGDYEPLDWWDWGVPAPGTKLVMGN